MGERGGRGREMGGKRGWGGEEVEEEVDHIIPPKLWKTMRQHTKHMVPPQQT